MPNLKVVCGNNASSSQWCGCIYTLYYTHLKSAILLYKIVLVTFFKSTRVLIAGKLAATQSQKPILVFISSFISRLLPKACLIYHYSTSIGQHWHWLALALLSIIQDCSALLSNMIQFLYYGIPNKRTRYVYQFRAFFPDGTPFIRRGYVY